MALLAWRVDHRQEQTKYRHGVYTGLIQGRPRIDVETFPG